jgi:3-deoxy-D-manno-octulosonic-acid transferase
VCLVETEIWPNFLAACRRRSIPVVLANGRISDRSFRSYRRAGWLLARVLDDVRLFLMQSPADSERIRALGARAERVAVAGNLKYDVDRAASEARLAPKRVALAEALGLPDRRPLIVAGSTAEGEEAILAECLALVRARAGLESARLLVAPRHPERFDEAARVLERAGLSVARRSRPGDAAGADCLLLDSIGELAAVYEFADVVFVGGSLVPRGGHNVLEPALYARPIVVGPHTENFRQIVEDFKAAGALAQLPPAAAGAGAAAPLADAFAELLADAERAREMGARGLAVLEANRGATARVVEAIARLGAEGAHAAGRRAAAS